MTDSGPIYAVDPKEREGAISAVELQVDYHDSKEFVKDCTEMLAAGASVITPRQPVQRGMVVTLVMSFPGLTRPLHLGAVVAAVDETPKASGSLRVRARVELEHLEPDVVARITTHLKAIEASDPAYVVRAIRVLVVEDNPHCARLIQEGLRLAGRRAFGNRVAFDVPMASNAADALTYLHSRPIDVLITDIYLGGVSGTTVIEHVRADSGLRALPVIAISAGDEATRDAALEAGADVFLPKPVRLRQIVGTVGKVLSLEQTAWR